jgi:hypothetical protein
MNSQSPQQQPTGQSQASQRLPSSPQPSQSKKSRRLTKEEKIALIGAASAIIVAIITYVLAPVVVSKFGLTTTPTATASPTTTSTPSGTTSNVYPPVGWKLDYSDPMTSNSSGYWHVSAHGLAGYDGICTFTNDVYEVIETIKGDTHICDNYYYGFTDFALEVQMTIVNGDQGGFEFRLDEQTRNFYNFWISSSGTYGLEICDNGKLSQTLSSGSSAAIHSGFNQLNIVAVVAQGNIFKLYANNQ